MTGNVRVYIQYLHTKQRSVTPSLVDHNNVASSFLGPTDRCFAPWGLINWPLESTSVREKEKSLVHLTRLA